MAIRQWWCILLTAGLGGEFCEFQASLVYKTSSKIARAVMKRNLLSKTKTNKQKLQLICLISMKKEHSPKVDIKKQVYKSNSEQKSHPETREEMNPQHCLFTHIDSTSMKLQWSHECKLCSIQNPGENVFLFIFLVTHFSHTYF